MFEDCWAQGPVGLVWLFAQVGRQGRTRGSPELVLSPRDYHVAGVPPVLAFKNLSVLPGAGRSARARPQAARPNRLRLNLPRGVTGMAVGGPARLVWALCILHPCPARTSPLSRWLLACHAPVSLRALLLKLWNSCTPETGGWWQVGGWGMQNEASVLVVGAGWVQCSYIVDCHGGKAVENGVGWVGVLLDKSHLHAG